MKAINTNWRYKRFFIYKLLLPIMMGIVLAYHKALPELLHQIIGISSLFIIFGFNRLPNWFKYQYQLIKVTGLYTLLFAVGLMIGYKQNIYNKQNVATNFYNPKAPVWLELTEDISTKPNSFKTEANILYVYINNTWVKTSGKVIVYFKKDSTAKPPVLTYKQQIITTQNLQSIKNAGNPGGFNYKQYTAFNDILYQVFIPNNNYVLLPTKQISTIEQFVYSTRNSILQILRNRVHTPTELAIAQALLIGYRNDLDRDTVQAYSNTGIVHIIAISGMHLAMIYGLLIWLFSFIDKYSFVKIIKLIAILAVLWSFTLIAGAAPSILRSAIMFSCIAIGNVVNKKSSIYHTLGLSAIIILSVQPFSLWDVGFQLSYTAVLSIVVFDKFFKTAFYIPQKWLQKIWHICAVTMAAQIFTLPLVLYHFHQFPVLFLFTNLVAVPLSGVVLYACIALLIFNFIPIVGVYIGNCIQWLLYCLNKLIFAVNNSGIAVWPSIQLSIIQTCILYIAIIVFSIWLLQKNKRMFIVGLVAVFCFIVVRSVDIIERNTQHKLIVYNVPKHTAVDIVEGRSYFFIGDSILLEDGFLRNFHLKPARTLYRVSPKNTLENTWLKNNIIQSNAKTVLIINNDLPKYAQVADKIKADVIVLTGNPKIYIQQLAKYFTCKLLVFDASNSVTKINYWKRDAAALNIPFYNVVEEGAFVTSL